jgi:predicted ester cyclase
MLSGTAFDPALLAAGHRTAAFHPVDAGEGEEFYRTALVDPLVAAFAGLEVRPDIRIGGTFEGGDWIATSGHLAGRFVAPLFGIPPTGRAAWVRFGRFDRLTPGMTPAQAGLIAETLLLLDLPALMLAAGCWPLGPALGPGPVAPGPLGHDGLAPSNDPALALASLELVEAMIGGLKRYDGASLASMAMPSYWCDDFWWHGPAPIGSFQGHAAYEAGHQLPFLSAFPDRVGGNHRARIAQGRFVASTGWPSICATHSGGDWLGLAATGRPVTMRVMDWWAVADGRLAENWVMIDIPDLLQQLGVDLFGRMRALSAA